MNAAPLRSYTRLAIAIVIAAVVISASILSYSSFEATVTRTTKVVSTTTVTVTSTVLPNPQGSCLIPASNATSTFATNCPLGIQLGLSASPTIALGANETITLSLTNTLPFPNHATFTGLPSLPGGINASDFKQFLDYFLPPLSSCGPPAFPFGVPAYVAIYNSTMSPLQLNDNVPIYTPCVFVEPNDSQLSVSQTVSERISVGGDWQSQNLSEPWVGATYNRFSPGSYKIIAIDPWGSFAELNFTVVSGITTVSMGSSTGTSTSASGAPISISSIETANIPIGGEPRLIAVDSNTSRIYVSDWFSNNLTVIDATTHDVVTVIALPGGVEYGIAVNPKTDMVYVPVEACTNTEAASNSCDLPGASSNAAGIVEINGGTNEITGELPFGVAGLAINPTTDTLYGTGGAGLLAINAGTGSLMANISLTAGGPSIAVDQDTNMVYVAACGAGGGLVCGSEVFLVNGTSQRLQATVQLGFGTYPRVAVDPSTNVAYVTGDSRVVALNGTTGQMIYSADTSTCATIDGLSVNPVTNEVYATPIGLNYLLVFDGATGHLVNMYSSTEEPQYPSFNPGTGELYVTLPGSLVIFPDITSTGHVDTSLLGGSENCPLP